jgi:hypothetical protein
MVADHQKEEEYNNFKEIRRKWQDILDQKPE